VFTFIAIRGVSHGLTHIVTLTHVSSPPLHPTIPLPTTNKEDSIKTPSLSTLASCSNIEIRKAATKILCERFFSHPPSRNRLLNDLTSPKPRVQRRARLAFGLLCEHGVVQEVQLPATPRALRSSRSRRLQEGMRDAEGDDRGPEMRGLEDSIEERDLRRRRREAMVLHEGDRPVSQEDVWMRDGDGRFGTEEMQVSGV
jgi:hypothetical protein